VRKRRSSERILRYPFKVTVRLSPEEMEFIDMIARRTGSTWSTAVRTAIDMLMIALSAEAIDEEKFRRKLEEIARRGPVYVYISGEVQGTPRKSRPNTKTG